MKLIMKVDNTSDTHKLCEAIKRKWITLDLL